MSHIFISYSRKDQTYATQLADDIRKHGFDVWIDDRIDYGERWFDEIEEAIDGCAAFVVIMSPASRKSKWVQREIMIADRDNKPLFPLLLKGREFGSLIDIQSVNVSGGRLPGPDFYERLAEVKKPAPQTGKWIAPTEKAARRHTASVSQFPWVAAMLLLVLIVAGIVAVFTLRGGDDDEAAARTPMQTALARNIVLEITQAGSRLNARTTPSTDEDNILDLLFWGDRVLWSGNVVSAEGDEWIEVRLGSGHTVYLINDASYYEERDLTRSMAGLEIGATIRITEDGEGMHLRVDTSTTSHEVKTLEAGDTLDVIGGPVNAEYYLWWELQLPDGRTGYAVEVPGWWHIED